MVFFFRYDGDRYVGVFDDVVTDTPQDGTADGAHPPAPHHDHGGLFTFCQLTDRSSRRTRFNKDSGFVLLMRGVGLK